MYQTCIQRGESPEIIDELENSLHEVEKTLMATLDLVKGRCKKGRG
jgi:hypothetical protein